MEITELNEKIKNESAFVDTLFGEIGKAIVGQKEMVERLIIGLLSNGHVLLEGVPGLATVKRTETFLLKKGPFFQTSFWLMKSTALPQKYKALCSKRCRKDR